MHRSPASSIPGRAGRHWCAAFAIGAALIAARAAALDLHSVEATYEDGVFQVSLEAVLDAPLAAVESVLADYTRYRSLDPRIKRAQLLRVEPDGAQIVRTRIDACAALFCRTVERVERFQREPGLLLATVVPELSDMRHGVARTRLQSQGPGTLVVYQAEFEPDFWVPGFIGHRYAVRALRDSIEQMFVNVEKEAHGP